MSSSHSNEHSHINITNILPWPLSRTNANRFTVNTVSTSGCVSSNATTISTLASSSTSSINQVSIEVLNTDIRPGEFVLRTLFAQFTVLAEKKIDLVLSCEPLERPLSKSLQRGEDAVFDQLLNAFGSVAEHCLPSLLRTLFGWYDRQIKATENIAEQKSIKSCSTDSQSRATGKNVANADLEKFEQIYLLEKRDLAVEFIFDLVLIEVLKQLSLHPGHEDLVIHIENLAFKHFRFREGAQNDPNIQNINIVADLYAEVVGVLAQSRFQSVRKRFMLEFKELKSKEPSPITTHSIISLLMGMKFFRVKMVPIEEFEASFQFMHECAIYFLEVKDKDIKHALAGLFVEILVPVAATVKNEVNVPCLKNLVEMMYAATLDLCTKKKHSLALFPLVTCLLCVSQKTFFLQNWHYFLAMCLSNLKNRDPKMSRVALESLYRLLWVYMIRIKCESNTATQSRLHSIVNSLFPKGSKAVVPRDTPLNIFVKIIQFIAQERLDFAMKEIVFDLLSVGRSIKIILTPERISIGLRAFLVVADSLQQKDGEPPMPRTVGVLPSGNTLRVKKTYLNKMLTEEMARTIGMNHYYSYVRKTFSDILRALDVQFGRPLMMTTMQNINKEPDDMITGERKPKIDLFRTCVAAIPRLIPDGMSRQDLIDLLARLTVHMDEEMKGLAFQSLQNIIADFPEWREDVVEGFVHFFLREINDTFPHLMDNSLRMLLQIITSWKNAVTSNNDKVRQDIHPEVTASKQEHTSTVIHNVEALALTLLCYCRQPVRRIASHILKEARNLFKVLLPNKEGDELVADVMDRFIPSVIELSFPYIPSNEKASILSLSFNVDLQWLAERSSNSWINAQFDVDSNSCKLIGNSETTSPAEPKLNAWSICFMNLIDELIKYSPSAVSLSWPLICHRLNMLVTHLDPTPSSDSRAASLLRGTTSTAKKTPTDRDFYLELWKNYLMYACRIAPTSTNTSLPAVKFVPQETCASPDSMTSERSVESKSPMNRGVSSPSLFKQIIPLLRNDQVDLRNAVVLGLSQVNYLAFKELMEELVPYIREAIDRKQENVRRRKRREILRIQLGKLLQLISERNILGVSPCVLDRDAGSLSNTFVEYIDGARLCLESEIDTKDMSVSAHDIKQHFCIFVSKLVKSFPIEVRPNMLSRDLRRNLFYLFASWSGKYGSTIFANPKTKPCKEDEFETVNESEYASLVAMSSVLVCGPIFDPHCLSEDSNLYPWLISLLSSKDERIKDLGLESIVLLLEYNTDIGTLLDWLVDCCYTKDIQVADGCFNALATIFNARDYPCDHYIAIINVTLMNVGCPRASVHQLAMNLLQILDHRFFASSTNDMLNLQNDDNETEQQDDEANLDQVSIEQDSDLQHIQLRVKVKNQARKMFEPLLSGTFPCSQLEISRRMAELHPQLTMPVFSEITFRFQTARPSVCQNLLQYLIPWLYNMELVDPHVQPLQHPYNASPETMLDNDDFTKGGWGSSEATEMALNNLFFITVKFGDDFPKEIEDVWAALCASWPNNLRIIIRYLFIVTGLAPNELLSYSKRVVLYMARSKPERLIDEMMTELQTVESLNCLTERTEAPPFFRITSIRKGSGHSDECVNGSNGNVECNQNGMLTLEQGTLHTKRHSAAADGISDRYGNSENPFLSVANANSIRHSKRKENALYDANFYLSNENLLARTTIALESTQKPTTPQPRPLPMPEFGGYYAPLTEYLPNNSQQPVVGFHRCNLSLMLICDLVIDGISIDWTPHIPTMLHVIFLGLDHPKSFVHEHCKSLLLNLLIVLTRHNDHLNVARILLLNKTQQLGYGLAATHPHSSTPRPLPNFIDPPNSKISVTSNGNSRQSSLGRNRNRQLFQPNAGQATMKENSKADDKEVAKEVENDENSNDDKTTYTLETLIKCLIDFVSSKKGIPLWSYEDINAKVWTIRSAEQLAYFLENVLYVFKESMPSARIEERWAEVSLQLALSCSSRHYAGRSLQIFRALQMPINSRMLSDILSRLVETVAEQGEDMQGYVTELMLTLEAALDSLDSEIRIMGELVRDFFKSSPNLLTKDNRKSAPVMTTPTKSTAMVNNEAANVFHASPILNSKHSHCNHIRSTSYSVSYPGKKISDFTMNDYGKDARIRCNTDLDVNKGSPFNGNNLGRSRSAQSLKALDEQYMTPDDKTSLLAQFFWIAVAMLETDYEHEFLLALRLLDKVLLKIQLEKCESQEKVEKIYNQMKWNQFPGVYPLLLKGCTSPSTYEPTMVLLHRIIPLLEIPVIDPSESSNSFPHLVIAQLPYLLLNYDDPNNLCIQTADSYSHWCTEKSKKLDNLATVMMLYSRRSFTKENLQWTKCVVKYLYDAYAHTFLNLFAFLIEVAEKGPTNVLPHILSVIHCMLHYLEISSTSSINSDIYKLANKYIESPQWKDALKILKLIVTRSSTLAAPPVMPSYNYGYGFNSILSGLQPSNHSSYSADCVSIASGASFADSEFSSKRELPGRTMDFTFDITQTPIVGRKYINKNNSSNDVTITSAVETNEKVSEEKENTSSSPRRSLSHNPSFNENNCNWRRPWLSQSRIRERLIGLLMSCGQRVGLPKSPSVIFSQNSDIIDRQSSMASSTEEISATNNDASGDSKLEDGTHGEFGLFKEFDFLEYELESQEAESLDNFNWGVRRRSLSNLGDQENDTRAASPMRAAASLSSIRKDEFSSDEEGGSVSPLYDVSSEMTLQSNSMFLPNALPLLDSDRHRPASMMSHSSSHSIGSEGDLTLSNTSASHSISPHIQQAHHDETNDIEDQWISHVSLLMNDSTGTESAQTHHLLSRTLNDTFKKVVLITHDSFQQLPSEVQLYQTIKSHFNALLDLYSNQIELPFIYVDAQLFSSNSTLLERHRFGVLEVQEHWETFVEKRNHVSQQLRDIRNNVRLESLGEMDAPESTVDEMRNDLCKCLYKMHFQLLLLIESYSKLVATLSSFSNESSTMNLSNQVTSVKRELMASFDDFESDRNSTSSSPQSEAGAVAENNMRTESESHLRELVGTQQWTRAIKHLHNMRQHFPGYSCLGSSEDDDMNVLLGMFCQQTCESKNFYVVITECDHNLSEMTRLLMETCFQLSSTLHSLDSYSHSQNTAI